MPARTLTDRDGATWRVWSTFPRDARTCLPGFEHGWLTFESLETGERRRLTPIPSDWETVSEDRLRLLCRVAQPGRDAGRETPPIGMPAYGR